MTYLQDNRAAMSIKRCQKQPYFISTMDQDLESYRPAYLGALLFSEIDSLYYGDICYVKVLEELYALNYLCSQWHCVFVAVDFE